MLKIKLTRFIAVRVLILCIMLSVVTIIWVESRWFTLAGLIFGSAFGVIKFGSFAWFFSRISTGIRNPALKSSLTKKGLTGFLINQIIIFPLLLAAYLLDRWFFIGLVTGILLVPFVLMINCVTEVLNITCNNFE